VLQGSQSRGKFASTPTDKDRLEFLITIYKGRLFSDYLDERMRVGGELEIVEPYGTFGLREGAAEAMCIGGGSGLAPVTKATFAQRASVQR
jgi:ferredoxin-NADP reductase